MPAISRRTWLGAFTLLLCSACGSDPAAPDPGATPAGDPPPFVLSVETAGQTSVDQPLTVRLVVTNTSTRGEWFRYAGRPGSPHFDVVVFDQNDRIVWRRLAGSDIATTEFASTLAPGGTLTFTAEWDLRDGQGVRVAPGTYRVSGAIERSASLGTLSSKERATVTVTP